MTLHYIRTHAQTHTHIVRRRCPQNRRGSQRRLEGSDRSHLNDKDLLSIRTQTHKQMKLPKKLNGWIWLHFGWDFCGATTGRTSSGRMTMPNNIWQTAECLSKFGSGPGEGLDKGLSACCDSLGLGGLSVSRDWRLCGACGPRTLW